MKIHEIIPPPGTVPYTVVKTDKGRATAVVIIDRKKFDDFNRRYPVGNPARDQYLQENKEELIAAGEELKKHMMDPQYREYREKCVREQQQALHHLLGKLAMEQNEKAGA